VNSHWAVALSGAIPAVIAMWIVDRLDAKRPEPASLRRLVVFAGMLSVIPAVLLETWITRDVGGTLLPLDITYQGASFKAFIVAAAIEEACKIVVIYWLVWRRPEFDERMDGIVYASRAGLGFALVENCLYLLAQPTLKGQLVVWVMRAFLAVPGHAKGLGLIGGYLLAVAFHGAYDCSVFVQAPLTIEGYGSVAGVLKFAPMALTVAAFFVLRSMARTALRLDDADAARGAIGSLSAPRPARAEAP
jgi:RsiW-degrading membrane proteinase PrsW (M82 family)